MTLYEQLLADYEFAITTTLLNESTGWTMALTRAFKKGFKTYKNDKRVMGEYKRLMDFIQQSTDQPQIAEYPQSLYVHAIASDKRFAKGTLWAHLKGQKIGLLFKPNYQTKEITLLMLGTHQDLGWR